MRNGFSGRAGTAEYQAYSGEGGGNHAGGMRRERFLRKLLFKWLEEMGVIILLNTGFTEQKSALLGGEDARDMDLFDLGG